MSEGSGNVDWLERFACMIKVMEVKEGNVLAIPKSGTSKHSIALYQKYRKQPIRSDSSCDLYIEVR
jgi:hypothetical protein